MRTQLTTTLHRTATTLATKLSRSSLPRVATPCRTLHVGVTLSILPKSRVALTRSTHAALNLAASSRSAIALDCLRPYHVSFRTLDQRQPPSASDASSTSSTPQKSDLKEAQHSSASTAANDLDHDHDDHIQHQHTNPIPPNTNPKARMMIAFTCTVCNNRSHKTMSKHAYEHGVVIMQCDHCKNRHLIADHLGWFRTGGVTVEDLVQEKGETVRRLARDYQLVKDGEVAKDQDASLSATTTGATSQDTPAKTELELALEKAAEGMLEWIPKDVLEEEEERMRKSQESLDHSKKKD